MTIRLQVLAMCIISFTVGVVWTSEMWKAAVIHSGYAEMAGTELVWKDCTK